MRVAGLIDTADNDSTNNEITVFLDNKVKLSSSTLYTEEYKNLCVSTGSATISCSSRGYNVDVDIIATKYYYYPVMQRLNI